MPERRRTTTTRPLTKQMLRTIGIFQALIALPIALFLGLCVFATLVFWEPRTYFYDFVRDFLNAIMASGIIFVVIVQRRTNLDAEKTLIFEAVKSGLATALWLWLLLDSLFGPWQNRYYSRPEDMEKAKGARVARTVTAVVLLLLFFYPALGHAIDQWCREKYEGRSEEEVESGRGTGEQVESRPGSGGQVTSRPGTGTGEQEPLLPRSE